MPCFVQHECWAQVLVPFFGYIAAESAIGDRDWKNQFPVSHLAVSSVFHGCLFNLSLLEISDSTMLLD